MPFPNEHAARQREPSGFIRFRRDNSKGPAGISFIFGITAAGQAVIQSIRAAKKKWTVAAFRKWLADHDFKSSVEAAAAGATESDAFGTDLPGSVFVLEAEADELRAILLVEGRSVNGNVWTPAALEDVARLAVGAPIHLYDFSRRGDASHLNHWEALRLRLPPNIRDLLPEKLEGAQIATVTEAAVEDGPDGRRRVAARLEVLEKGKPLMRRLLEAAQQLGRKVGLSIHVPPGGLRAKASRFSRKVLGVTRLVGFDAVTQPSAGGRFVPVLEALARKEDTAMDRFLELLLRFVPEDQRSALEEILPKGVKTAKQLLGEHADFAAQLLEALDLDDLGDDQVGVVLEALAKKAEAEEGDGARKQAKKKQRQRTAEPDPQADAALEGRIGDLAKQLRQQGEDVKAILLESGRDLIETLVKAAKLPGKLADFATTHLGATLESQGRISKKDIDSFLSDLKKGLGSGQSGDGNSLLEARQQPRVHHIEQTYHSLDVCRAALEAMICGEREGEFEDDDGKKHKAPAFTGPKQAWQVITGDYFMEGSAFIRRQRRPHGVLESAGLEWWESNEFMMDYITKTGASLEAAILTTSFTALLSDTLKKRLMKEYAQLAHLWKRIARTTSVNDFKTRTIVRVGEFPDLATVNENAAYLEMTAIPTEESVTAAIAKRGGIQYITWEAILNDDLRKFRDIPAKLARAADRTLNAQVWGKLLNNTNWGHDSNPVFDLTNHLNLAAVTYSYDELKIARRVVSQQTDPDGEEAGRVRAAQAFCGPEMYDEVYEDLFSDGKPNLAVGTRGTGVDENAGQPNVLRSKYGWSLWEVHEFDNVSGRENDIIIAGLIEECEMLEVGFLNGREDPELFVQDLEKVGSFFDNDRLTYKVRHVHDNGVIVDYRALYLIQQT